MHSLAPRRLKMWLLCLAALPPVIFYFVTLYRLSLPVPILDDFNSTLSFLIAQNQLHSFLPRLLSAVSYQDGEYRFIFNHLLMALQFGLSPRFSFPLFIFLGDIFLLPAIYILWRNSFPEVPIERRLLLFLPVVYLTFQFVYVEMLDFAMAGIQFLIIPFILASIHLLLRNTSRAFACSCLFAILACLASPNGFLLGPIGILLLWPERRYRHMISWCLALASVLCVYLYHYYFSAQSHPRPQSLIAALLFFLSFVGGTIENMHHHPIPYASTALGSVLFLLYLDSLRTGYRRTHPFLFYGATWTFLTAAMVTFVRSSFGLQQSLSVRYKIYGTLLLAFSYLYVAYRVRASTGLKTARKRALYVAALSVAVLFCISADVVGYRFLQARHDRTLDAYAFYRADPAVNPPYINYHINGRVNGESISERNVLNDAIAKGLFAIPSLPPPPPEPQKSADSEAAQ